MKKRTTAAVLAFFVGGIGGHHWYLGNIGRGVVYLLFCWTLIPAFISFIEFVLFLISDDAAFNAKYNKAVAGTDNFTALKNLHDLKKDGAISEAEFAEQKKKLIA